MNSEGWIALGSFLFTVLTSTIGALLWLSQKQRADHAHQLLRAAETARRELAEERDFGHLKNNQLQHAQALNLILDEIREVKDAVAKLETYLISCGIIDRRKSQ